MTRLDATDLGSEVPGRVQQDILDGVDVTGTSTPQYMTPRSAPRILAPITKPLDDVCSVLKKQKRLERHFVVRSVPLTILFGFI